MLWLATGIAWLALVADNLFWHRGDVVLGYVQGAIAIVWLAAFSGNGGRAIVDSVAF